MILTSVADPLATWQALQNTIAVVKKKILCASSI
jgi:hypothetical protein